MEPDDNQAQESVTVAAGPIVVGERIIPMLRSVGDSALLPAQERVHYKQPTLKSNTLLCYG